MNLEPNNLTDDQRRLLGEQAADELARDQRWLVERMERVELPGQLAFRLSEAVATELARQRRRARPLRSVWPAGAAVAAAILLGGLFVIVETLGPRPPVGPGVKPGMHEAAAVMQAQRAVDAYVKTVGEDVVQMHDELNRLTRDVAAPDNNPWDSVIKAIEEPAGQS